MKKICKCGTADCHEVKNGYCLEPLQGRECHETERKERKKYNINYKALCFEFYPGERAYWDRVAEETL